jgi:hypothetical protein
MKPIAMPPSNVATKAMTKKIVVSIFYSNAERIHPLPVGKLRFQLKVYNFHLEFDSERVVAWCALPCHFIPVQV